MPSPFRMKAASIAQLEVQFTRAAVVVPLPMGSVIEFGIKAKNTDTPPLVYCNTFSATAGTLYAANVNLATVELEQALGIGDGDASNDKPQVELVGEIGWSTDGINLFRSQTFTLVVEAPVISGGAPSLYNPPRYPVLDGNVLHFVRGDGTLGTASSSGGMTTLTTYTGNIGTTDAPAGNIYGTFVGDGSGLTALNPNSFNASNWNGVDIGTNDQPLSSITASHFVGIGTPCFEGDGSNLYNVEAISLYLDGGRTLVYSGSDGSGWASSLGITAPFFTGDIYNANFNGIALSSFINASDGTVNAALTAGYANTAGASQFDFNTFFGIGWGAQDIGSVNYPYGTVYASGFVGDGSQLTGVSAVSVGFANTAYQFMGQPYSWAPNGTPSATAFNDFFSGSGVTSVGDIGFSYGGAIGNVYATAFYGDGSGLTNVGSGSTDLSSYTGDIGNSGTTAGAIYGTFYGDGSSMTAGYAYTSGGAALAQVAFNDFFTPTTNWTAMDLGQSGQSLGTVYANYFVGDGSGLSNVGGGTDLSSWGTPDIWGLGPVFGNQNGFYFDAQGNVGFAGHSAIATNVPNDFFPWYARQNQDFGESSLPLGTVYANSFVGDGSGLTNVGGSPDLSGYTGDIGNIGSRAGELYCQTIHSYDIHAEGSNVYAGRGYFSDYVVLPSLNYRPEAGGIYFNATTGEFYGYNGSAQVPFGGVPDLSNYTGDIGTSSFTLPNVCAMRGLFAHIEVDGLAILAPQESLPYPAPLGSIGYSAGHFYGMTDDGWKQLDS